MQFAVLEGVRVVETNGQITSAGQEALTADSGMQGLVQRQTRAINVDKLTTSEIPNPTRYEEIVRQGDSMTQYDREDFVLAVAIERCPLNAWLVSRLKAPVEAHFLAIVTNGQDTP